MENSGIHIFIVNETIKDSAIQWFRKYTDFVIMDTNNIELYVGFDEHFKQMSFIPINSAIRFKIT